VDISYRLIRSGAAGVFVAALALFASAAFSADTIIADGAPTTLPKAKEAASWRAAPDASNASAVTFVPLPAFAQKALREENSAPESKAVKIGVSRNADTELRGALFSLNWQNSGDGHIARATITSPDAKGISVALRIRALPDSAELRFSGSAAPEKILGVISGQEAKALRDSDKVYWTPATEGETQTIEIYLPSNVKPEEARIRLRGVSHLFASAQDGYLSKDAQYLSPVAKFGPTKKYTGQWIKVDNNGKNDEDAWGLTVLLNFPYNANYIFVPWYTYDSSGKALWYIFQGDVWSANDTFSADVYRFSGPNWGAFPYNNGSVSSSKVGTATLKFTSATTATFTYNVEGSSRTINLAKLQ